MRKKRILIAVGGSGGHLLPAQQLAENLKSEDFEILFVGNGLSTSSFFNREKFSYREISSSCVKKSFFCLVSFFPRILKGLGQSIKVMKNFKPELVVGFGSYHSFPPLLAAVILRKPILLFEANSLLGKVNRFFAKRAKKVALQLPLAERTFKNFSYVPFLPWEKKEKKTREKAASEKALNFQKNTLLVFGGSQGAVFLNRLMPKVFSVLKEKGQNFQIIHLTGSEQEEKIVADAYQKLNVGCYVRAYEKDMNTLFALSDLVIARAGAATIGEIIQYQIPALLIPFPFASEDHQRANAIFLQEKVGGGYYFDQNQVNAAKIAATVQRLFQEEKKELKLMQAMLALYYQAEEKLRKDKLSDLVCQMIERKE